MGMALTSCTVPAAGKPTFELGENEMEIGIGIHGEPGRHREPLGTAAEIAERLARPDRARPPSTRGDAVLAFVNGMGGTPLLELYVVFNEVARILDAATASRIERSLVGPYITSLEMAGCSITLLKLDDELVRLWDAPGAARRRCAGDAERDRRRRRPSTSSTAWVRASRELVAEHRGHLTELDSAIGDADHGINMDRGMQAVCRQARRTTPPAPPTSCSSWSG